MAQGAPSTLEPAEWPRECSAVWSQLTQLSWLQPTLVAAWLPVLVPRGAALLGTEQATCQRPLEKNTGHKAASPAQPPPDITGAQRAL